MSYYPTTKMYDKENQQRPQLRLWVKFQYGKSRSGKDVAIFKNYIKKGCSAESIATKLINLTFKTFILKDLIWQAKIFQHPGNKEIWHWDNYNQKKEDSDG